MLTRQFSGFHFFLWSRKLVNEAKKSSIASGNRPVDYSSARIVECVSEYIVLILKKKNKQEDKEKEKESKEEKRISVENLMGYDDIVCKLVL